MIRIHQILNKYPFPTEVRTKLQRKKTERGMLRELSTLENVMAAYPNDEAVFQEVYHSRRLNANDTCTCGCLISQNYKRVSGKKQFKCGPCGKKVSPLVGTAFEECRCGMERIIFCIAKNFIEKIGYTSTSVSREKNWRYQTYRNIRYRAAILMGNALDKLEFAPDIPIEADEVYMRIPSGLPKGVRLTRGLGSERTKPVSVQLQRQGLVRATVIEEVNQPTLKPLFHSTISKGSTIYTDGAPVYNFLSQNYNHHFVNHRKKIWAQGDVHVNETEAFNGNSKNQINHIHLGVTEKHLQKYINEAATRFSHRFTDVYKVLENIFAALPPLK